MTWLEFLISIAKKNKPIFLATGASEMKEVEQAVSNILLHNKNLCLMQCNTNYTANLDNFKFIQLNVLKSFATNFPEILLGLSDHTPGHSTVLGSVALGARAIEKHFTDIMIEKVHIFSMNPKTWMKWF